MYEQFFGLEDEPFRLTPDPRYLFLSTKHAEALAHLRLGLSDSSGFVCITGDVGTGKTTLLRTFLSQLGPNVTAAYSLVPPLSATELLRRVCREFGLGVQEDSQERLVEHLHAYLIEQRNAGRLCVLVLDEAQALSIELLEQIRLLLNLETETQKLLRIVLVGQPQLSKLLLDPELAQLNQRITLRWHLGPLSSRETAAYVNHRISVSSGGRAVELFTPPALRLLHSVSGGIPRLINMIGHRALLAAFVARDVRVHRRSVARAYREIQVVPLPGTLTPARKAAWAAAGLLIGITVVAFGAPAFDRLLSRSVQAPAAPSAHEGSPALHTAAHRGDAPPAAQDARQPADPAVVPAGAIASAPADAPDPQRAATVRDPEGRAAAPPRAGPVVAAAAAGSSPPLGLVAVPPAAISPMTAPREAMPPVALPPAVVPADTSPKEVFQLLAGLDAPQSASAATDAVLAAWNEPPLATDETRLPADLAAAAWRRGLQDLVLKTNLDMLRFLNLPAVIALRVPGVTGVRYVALTGIDGAKAVLSANGVSRNMDIKALEQVWSGEAHVLWRDFNAVGPGLRWGARGAGVVRLQELLVRAGALVGTPTGTFDTGTEHGVLNFQRAHRLDPDGIVGPLTSIALYAAVGSNRPRLDVRAQGAS